MGFLLRRRSVLMFGVSALAVFNAVASTHLRAQIVPGLPPFFGPSPGVAYNPEPAAVFTGHNVHTGATVSSDRKTVQLNMVPQQSAVIGVVNFIFVTEGGFVGTPGSAGGTTNRPPVDPGIRGSSPTPPSAATASAPLTGVLGQSGMTRLGGL